MSIITVLLVFMFLVFFHELGHFTAAKKLGVTVEKFSIGFGMFGLLKPIIQKHYKGTLYVIYPTLFLGGYVQMKGQVDSNPTLQNYDNDSYTVKKPWEKIIILLAGPFANFLLAAVLYFAIALMGNKAISPTIGKIVPNSPAFIAGLQVDDKIVKINNIDIVTWKQLGNAIKQSHNNIKVYVKRANTYKSFIIKPKISDAKNLFKENIKKRMIGISPAPILIDMTYTPIQALKYAYDKTIESSSMIFLGVQKLISGVVPSSEVGGVISITKVISDASNAGIIAIFTIAALISVNLAVLNLLPIPMLDGGHIMFNLYELITKKAPSPKVLNAFSLIGIILLFSLMFLGIYNDINRFF
jgi:regulator of sigma E protease